MRYTYKPGGFAESSQRYGKCAEGHIFNLNVVGDLIFCINNYGSHICTAQIVEWYDDFKKLPVGNSDKYDPRREEKFGSKADDAKRARLRSPDLSNRGMGEEAKGDSFESGAARRGRPKKKTEEDL